MDLLKHYKNSYLSYFLMYFFFFFSLVVGRGFVSLGKSLYFSNKA